MDWTQFIHSCWTSGVCYLLPMVDSLYWQLLFKHEFVIDMKLYWSTCQSKLYDWCIMTSLGSVNNQVWIVNRGQAHGCFILVIRSCFCVFFFWDHFGNPTSPQIVWNQSNGIGLTRIGHDQQSWPCRDSHDRRQVDTCIGTCVPGSLPLPQNL